MVKDKVIRWMILACQWSISWISEWFKDINDWHTVSFTNMHVSFINMHVSLTKPVHWSVMCFVSLTDLWYQSPICLNRWPIVVSSHWFPCIAIQIAVSFTSMPLSLTNTLLSLISVKTTLKNLACSRTINDSPPVKTNMALWLQTAWGCSSWKREFVWLSAENRREEKSSRN